MSADIPGNPRMPTDFLVRKERINRYLAEISFDSDKVIIPIGANDSIKLNNTYWVYAMRSFGMYLSQLFPDEFDDSFLTFSGTKKGVEKYTLESFHKLPKRLEAAELILGGTRGIFDGESGGILDLGCGAGFAGLKMADINPDISAIGIDHALDTERPIDITKRGAQFTKADWTELPLPDSSVKMTLSKTALVYYENDRNRLIKSIQEIDRVSETGAVFRGNGQAAQVNPFSFGSFGFEKTMTPVTIAKYIFQSLDWDTVLDYRVVPELPGYRSPLLCAVKK